MPMAINIEAQVEVAGDQHAAYEGWLQYVWHDGGMFEPGILVV